MFIDTNKPTLPLDEYYELFFSRPPLSSNPLPEQSLILKPKRIFKDPESKENVEKFIKEIDMLGSTTSGLTKNTSKESQAVFDKVTGIRITRLKKNSWKDYCRNPNKS
jgi:predicted RNA-binding protein